MVGFKVGALIGLEDTAEVGFDRTDAERLKDLERDSLFSA